MHSTDSAEQHRFTSELSILFHWPVCIMWYGTVLTTKLCNKLWNKQVWVLQHCCFVLFFSPKIVLMIKGSGQFRMKLRIPMKEHWTWRSGLAMTTKTTLKCTAILISSLPNHEFRFLSIAFKSALIGAAGQRSPIVGIFSPQRRTPMKRFCTPWQDTFAYAYQYL